MTENDLKSIRAINLEIARLKNERRLLVCSSGSVRAIDNYKKHLQENEDRLLERKAEIENLINKITDAEIRLIFKLKFIDLKSWNYIADTMHYDRTTVYKKYKKYLGGIK